MMRVTNTQSATSSADVFEWRNAEGALCALERPITELQPYNLSSYLTIELQ